MPKIYRTMASENGKPKIGQARGMLGVRPPASDPKRADVRINDKGFVIREEAGMSVGPELSSLPFFLVPARLKDVVPGATGNPSWNVWSMGEGPFEDGVIAPELELRRDPRNAQHGFVRPTKDMTLEVFQLALGATRDSWRVDENG